MDDVETRWFPLSDVLSITWPCEHSFPPGGKDGAYELGFFLTGGPYLLVDGVIEQCREYLFEQFPKLRDVDLAGVERDWRDWLDRQMVLFGEDLEVKPFLPGRLILTEYCRLRPPK